MRTSDIDKVNISQICHALSVIDPEGEELFLNVYPHEIALDIFEGGERAVVEVRRTKEGESSKYWAWFKYYTKQPYMFIWPDKEKTISCIPNMEKRIQNKEGKLVNVVVKRWKKI
jgi:hypothetical protein